MKKLKFKYLRIIFDDGSDVEFFNSGIDHIETQTNTYAGFIVRIFYNVTVFCNETDEFCKSRVDEYIYNIELIKAIEQR